MKINYKSDFKILEECFDGDLTTPFRFTYKTSSLNTYIVEFDGDQYRSCRRNDDGSLLAIFDRHRLGTGRLHVQREYFLTDTDFAENICNTVTFETLDIILTSKDCDVDTPTIGVYPAHQNDDTGNSGDSGDTGDSGTTAESFSFEIIDGYLYLTSSEDSSVEFSINENGELLAAW